MKVLRYFSYRTAFVRGCTTCFPRDDMEVFERKIADLSRTNMGNEEHKHVPNHTCFEIEDERHQVRFIMFHDLNVIIGNEIDIKRW